MSSVEVRKSTEPVVGVKPVDMKFEVVIGVTDVNRARDFYKSLAGDSISPLIEATFMECKERRLTQKLRSSLERE